LITTLEFEPDAGMGDFGTSGTCWELLDVKKQALARGTVT
jgi:hypothetical protein